MHFPKKADVHQILEVICDGKTKEAGTQRYFYFGKCFFFSDLFPAPMTIFSVEWIPS